VPPSDSFLLLTSRVIEALGLYAFQIFIFRVDCIEMASEEDELPIALLKIMNISKW